MIELFIIVCIIPALGVKQNPFENDKIRQRRRDPTRRIIKDEFLVFFDENCLSQQNTTQRDVIKEFLNLYPCYKLNRDIQKTKKYRNIGDYWIVVNKKKKCRKNDKTEIEFNNYCITEVDEDEEITLYQTETADCTSRTVASSLWNLDQATPSITNGFEYIEYDLNYNGFDIIVMDSGIESTHSQFEGISINRIYDAYPGDALGDHGTHVAGTIVGNDYGVFRAKDTGISLIDVRIFGTDGVTTWTHVYNAYDSIIFYLISMSDPISIYKAIINYSFGGPYTEQEEMRLQLIKENGGIQIAAAGNDNQTASNKSPASSDTTITVGAHNENNDRAWFSNYGDKVDIWAPGTNILSSITNDSSAVFQGTSMATPFIAGIAANILANNLHSVDFHVMQQEDILQRMLDFAVYDVDDGLGNTNLPRAQISCQEYCGDSDCGGGNSGIQFAGFKEENKGVDDFELFETNGNNYKWMDDVGQYVSHSDIAWIILLSILLLITCINCYKFITRRKSNVKRDILL